MIIKLIHPQLGTCAQEVVMKNLENIKTKWKHKYGKKFYECDMFIERPSNYDEKRVIVNIRTGEEYSSIKQAAKDLDVTEPTIMKHLNKGLKPGSEYLYLVKWSKR
jgi:hypothetical protein